MTYCVGIEVDEGLVFAADTRTNASLDDVRVHRKLHVFDYPGQAAFVLMAAGNLATTQLLVSRLTRDAAERRTPNLRDMSHLFEAAAYVGQLLVDSQVKCQHSEHGHDGVNTQATLIFGGQVAGERPGLYWSIRWATPLPPHRKRRTCRSANPSTASRSWIASSARPRAWAMPHARPSCRSIPPSVRTCRWACRSTWH